MTPFKSPIIVMILLLVRVEALLWDEGVTFFSHISLVWGDIFCGRAAVDELGDAWFRHVAFVIAIIVAGLVAVIHLRMLIVDVELIIVISIAHEQRVGGS